MTQPMPSSDILANTKIWFSRVRPEDQLNGNHFHSQLGCHFEEIAEMIDELEEAQVGTAGVALFEARKAMHTVAEMLKAAAKEGVELVQIANRVKFLDSICDQIVTGVGTAHTQKMDPLNGMIAVNISNYSKFGNDGQPIYDENHKMIKGPNYVEANLAPYV